MRKPRRMAQLLVPVLAAAALTAAATLRAQQSPPQSADEQQRVRHLYEHLDKFPAADYDAADDPDKRAGRQRKSAKYNRPTRKRFDPSSPSIASMSNDWEWGLESTLPVRQSSAVVVGTVSDARAFLSEDKAHVYSEYTVQVEAVLKNFAGEPVKAGDTLVVERQGGRVRLRSGAVSGFFIDGQNPPQAGRRYVFFLGYNKNDATSLGATDPAELSHHILTAYGLRKGKVEALDDPGGVYFKEHDGKDEAAFLEQIRRLLAEPSQTPPE
jgi:hypothetical protein